MLLKLVPPRVALALAAIGACAVGGAAVASHVAEARRHEAAAVIDGWRRVAGMEHLATALRKAEAVCAGIEPGPRPASARALAPDREVLAAWERLLADGAPETASAVQPWTAVLREVSAIAADPGCGAPFGLAAAAVEDLAALQRGELGGADADAGVGRRIGIATTVFVGTEAAVLLLVAVAAQSLRSHLRERERLEAEQRRALELQQRLMGIVGHDLRTPLNAIAGSAALLARATDLPSSRARAAQRIVTSAARMSGLVRDLLDYTRLRVTGGFSVVPTPADLGEVAAAVVQEVRSAWPRSHIQIAAEGDLRGFWDAERIEQVLSNLVGNACHHGEPGTPVRVRLAGATTTVKVSVHNEGPPISPQALPAIFEPFRRGTSDRHDASGGVGLGLFIVRSLVAAHGGSISVDSGSAGTTFTVVLPRDARTVSAPASPGTRPAPSDLP